MCTNGNDDGLGFDSLGLPAQGWLNHYVVIAIKLSTSGNDSNAFVFEGQQHVLGLALRQGKKPFVYRL